MLGFCGVLMLMTTEQVNVRLTLDEIRFLEEHPPVSLAGVPGQTRKRTAVIRHLIERAMKRSAKRRPRNQGDGPGKP